DPRQTSALYERFVTKDKVNGLLSPYTSTEVLTGSAMAEKHQVPMIQAGGGAGRIVAKGYKYVFGTLPTPEDEFRSIVGMLEQLTPKAKTVGLISSDDSDSAPTAGTAELLKKAGMEIVLNQQYSERIPNFFNILTLLKGRSPDVLFWSGREVNAIS